MKKFLRIVLKGTPTLWYDHEIGEIPINQIVAQMQMSGYLLTPTFFVPWDSIAHMCMIQVNGEQPLDFTKARMQ